MHSGYGKAFDGAGSWNFGNGFSSNVGIFGIDNGSPSHIDNPKNMFLVLVLGQGPNYGINGSFGLSEKKFSIIFRTAKRKFCISFYYNADNRHLFVNEKGIFKIESDNKNINFSTQF